jgi:hypothetical protein
MQPWEQEWGAQKSPTAAPSQSDSAPWQMDWGGKQRAAGAPAAALTDSAPWGETAVDAAKQLGVETGRAGLAALGTGGDVRGIGSWLADKAGSAIGASPESVDKFKSVARRSAAAIPLVGPALALGPSTSQIEGAVQDNVTGPFRKADTPTGQFIGNAGGFALGAALPGGPVRKVANVLAPWLGSEAGRQVGGDTGALVGALTGGVTAGMRGPVKSAAGRIENIKQDAQSAYRASEDAGLVIGQPRIKAAVDELRTELAKEGAHPKITPKAFAAFEELEKTAGQHVSLKGLDVLRQIAGNALGSSDKAERRLAYIIRDKMDDLIDDLKPTDIVAANAGANTPEAIAALKQGRSLWADKSRGETIERLFEKAKNAETGSYEKVLRGEFKKLANNERGMRRFTPDQQKAIKDAARGGVTRTIMRTLGSFGPTPTNLVLPALGAGAAGYGTGDMTAPLALALMGSLGRLGATRSTVGRANLARELAMGGKRPPSQVPAGVARALIASGGAQ